MKEYKGIMNIWVKKFDESFAQARPLTDSPRPLYGYHLLFAIPLCNAARHLIRQPAAPHCSKNPLYIDQYAAAGKI